MFWRQMGILAVGMPILVCLIGGGDWALSVKAEVDWRHHTDIWAFLEKWPGGMHRRIDALHEQGEAQRKDGLVARLARFDNFDREFRRQTLHAGWSGDGREIITSDGMQVHVWSASNGAYLRSFGATSRRTASDVEKFGYGHNEAVVLADGKTIAATTSSPAALHRYPGAPVVLGESSYEMLRAALGGVTMMRSTEYGLSVALPSGKLTKHPHVDVVAVGATPSGEVVTVSRAEAKWWRGEQVVRTVAFDGADHPAALSADASLMLAPTLRTLAVWETSTGKKRLSLVHSGDVSAQCAAGDYVAAGTEGGVISVWSAHDGTMRRSWRAHMEKVDNLHCGESQIVSTASGRNDGRVWRVGGGDGAANAPPVAPEPNWLIRTGADFDLPARAPWLLDLLEATGEFNVAIGAIGMLAIGGAVMWTGRRRTNAEPAKHKKSQQR